MGELSGLGAVSVGDTGRKLLAQNGDPVPVDVAIRPSSTSQGRYKVILAARLDEGYLVLCPEFRIEMS